jgi:maltose 6'-phosphate phosphatase
MRSINRRRGKGSLLIAVMILTFVFLWSVLQPGQCRADVELSVLTINSLFSEVDEREARLQRIAEFIADNPVDLILLQEVVGGRWSGTVNSAWDLKTKILDESGIEYDFAYRMANGVPRLLSVGNAILSRHRILYTLAKTLPFESEVVYEGIEIPLKRRAMMSRVKIPGFGKINVYNTHLCAFCDPAERYEQAAVLVDFINAVERFIWGASPAILGGDFNTNLSVPGEEEVYDLLTDEGFIDTYAAVYGCEVCCPDSGGCTYAVSGNPFTEQTFSERIDYVFVKGGTAVDSLVVFNVDPHWVSDHSGVLTWVRLSTP